MRQIALGALRLYGSKIPALLAFFLVGWILNYQLLRFAGYVANIDAIYGYLVLPLAVLVRIASYVAMFLVLRPGKSFLDSLSSSILPFLIVFATWGMLQEDWVGFSLAQLEQRRYDGTDPELFFGVTPITVGIVVVAFALRLVIKRYAAKLPRWFSFIAAYLEAVWIFIAIDIIAEVTGWVMGWVNTRVFVVWVQDVIGQIGAAVAPLRWIADGVTWVIGQAGVLIGQPLAWLTLAGIVYAVTSPYNTPTRLGSAARKRLERFPPFVRSRVTEVGTDFAGRWVPISQAARLIWRAGVITMAFFVLAYAVLDTSSDWLFIGVNQLIGPHDISFWRGIETILNLLVGAIVEPLRISLIAATWAYCLTLSEAGRTELGLEQEQRRERIGAPQP